MKSLLLNLFASIALCGCASAYNYDNVRYPDKETFNAAVQTKLSQAEATVVPLSAPVSNKTLVFAVPSEKKYFQQQAASFSKINGRTIGLGEEIIATPVWSSQLEGLRSFYRAIVRKNIYKNVRYIELDTMTPDILPTATEDIYFYSESQPGAGQFYYASQKSGKQAFSFDRGGPDMGARTRAFVEAIQVYAIRE